ncbi:hypothetical protein CC2G_004493 [Coprinopsis cinerea AmutBmut pab1-1]|nr:hypothetical protein CC2G_004493 [Coprinopsis cinerea AmutBmut pab1-1]
MLAVPHSPKLKLRLGSFPTESLPPRLAAAPTGIRSSDNMSSHYPNQSFQSRNNPRCTSYQGILSGTVDGVITLKNAAGVSSLVITGGTETGHATGGTYTHGNGYKVDVRHSTQLDNYIKTAFTKIANRGDGYPQWRAASGNIYCDEGSHWDITYF